MLPDLLAAIRKSLGGCASIHFPGGHHALAVSKTLRDYCIEHLVLAFEVIIEIAARYADCCSDIGKGRSFEPLFVKQLVGRAHDCVLVLFLAIMASFFLMPPLGSRLVG